MHVVGDEESSCVNWEDIELWNELSFPEQVFMLTKDQQMLQDVRFNEC